MGSVWVATDERLERPVAIKVLAEHDFGGQMLRRFELEAKAVARLRSPHIVEIYDYGVHEDTPYIAMELLEGQSLGEAAEARLPFGLAARLVGQIGRGLATAHAAGIVHRDLKPANIFLVQHLGEPLAKILDFGIAKLAAPGPERRRSANVTRPGEILGTPKFMSPEQIVSPAAVDARTDVWALGVISYLLFTGRHPFVPPGGGMGLPDLIHAIINQEPPPPSTIAELPPAVDALVARAMSKAPNGRFDSALELANAAFALVPGEATARLDPLPSPSQSGRHPAANEAATTQFESEDRDVTLLHDRSDSGAEDPTVARSIDVPLSDNGTIVGAPPAKDSPPSLRRALAAAAIVLGGILALALLPRRGPEAGASVPAAASSEPEAPIPPVAATTSAPVQPAMAASIRAEAPPPAADPSASAIPAPSTARPITPAKTAVAAQPSAAKGKSKDMFATPW